MRTAKLFERVEALTGMLESALRPSHRNWRTAWRRSAPKFTLLDVLFSTDSAEVSTKLKVFLSRSEKTFCVTFLCWQTGNRNVGSDTKASVVQIPWVSFANWNQNVGNNGQLWNFESLFRPLAVLVCVWNSFFWTLRVSIRFSYVSHGKTRIIRSKTRTVNTNTPLTEH